MVRPMILLGVGSRHEGERSCLVAASFCLILVGSAVVSGTVADRHPVVERDSKGERREQGNLAEDQGIALLLFIISRWR